MHSTPSHEHHIQLVHGLELAVRGAAQDGAQWVPPRQVDLQGRETSTASTASRGQNGKGRDENDRKS